ncbi:MAG: PH domain-containing protein [Candidatus Micrarchaeota archaeon]|nr:PH domain-containing protein [Candidatus Micrarchaeota archaeon]
MVRTADQQIYCGYTDNEALLLPNEIEIVSKALGGEDTITFMARERRLSAALSPSVIITTNKKLIIVSRQLAGLRSDISFIPYENIVSVRISQGIMLASLFIRMKGASGEISFSIFGRKDEGGINGISREEAEFLLSKVNAEIKTDAAMEAQENHYHVYGNVIKNNNVYVNNSNQQQSTDREPVQTHVLENGEGATNGATTPPFYQHERTVTIPEVVDAPKPTRKRAVSKKIKASDLMIFKMRKQAKAAAEESIPA